MPGARLGVEGREWIALGLAREEPVEEVARRMGCPTSTVAGEVNRRGGRPIYAGAAAWHVACNRAKRPKERRPIANAMLATAVAVGFGKRWSPAEVSARLVLDYPDDPEMCVSGETIYAIVERRSRILFLDDRPEGAPA